MTRLVKCATFVLDVMVTCYRCGRLLPHSEAWADLDGPAFEAYYHAECRPNLETPDQQTRST